MHRLSFPSFKKWWRQSKLPAEEEHDYENVFDGEKQDTTEDVKNVSHDYVNVAAATRESGVVKQYENCEFAKDLRRTSRDPKSRRIKTTPLPILDHSAKALAKSVPTISLVCVRETESVGNCSDDDSSLDSNYVDMTSKQMKAKLQRPKLGMSLSNSAPDIASTKQIAIYENERFSSTKTRRSRPISTKQDRTNFR